MSFSYFPSNLAILYQMAKPPVNTIFSWSLLDFFLHTSPLTNPKPRDKLYIVMSFTNMHKEYAAWKRGKLSSLLFSINII